MTPPPEDSIARGVAPAGITQDAPTVATPTPPVDRGRAPHVPPAGAVERLIERTVLPVPLPGLELRLVSPEQRAVADRRPASAEESGESAAGGERPAPTPSAPPQLDINALAERVYQTLQRRQQLERERRGLY